MAENSLLWKPCPSELKKTSIYKFLEIINFNYKLNLKTFKELHNWSIQNREDFWFEVWKFFDIVGSTGEKPFLFPENDLPGTKFFPRGQLNYAENMLRKKGDDPAVIFQSEDKIYKKLSWSKLRKQVATVTNYFVKRGVKKGDRVAAYLPNIPETIIVMLASA